MQPVQVTGSGEVEGGGRGRGAARGGTASGEAAGRSPTSEERWLRHRSAWGAGPPADLAITEHTCHCSLVRSRLSRFPVM